jgi:hypothetical protein
MDSRPIFIAGPNRSGTSLMYALLASHPKISMVQRTDMWRYFYEQYGSLSEEDNFERCLKTMLQYRRISRLEPDADRIRREFWTGEPTYGRLFALFHAHHAEMVGKSRWGDKSLHAEQHVDQIIAEFPQAKVILIVRDPRDRYASERKKFRASVGSATRKWLVSVNAVKHSIDHYPDSCLVIRYETLASHPEETLRRVCTFIEEEYSPMMLTMKGAPEHLEQGGDSSFESFKPGEISTRSIGRFPKVISKLDIAFIQQFAGRDMVEFDYQMHPVQFTWSNRLRFYLIIVPINIARMTRLYFVHLVKNKRGRSIDPHRFIDNVASNLVNNT